MKWTFSRVQDHLVHKFIDDLIDLLRTSISVLSLANVARSPFQFFLILDLNLPLTGNLTGDECLCLGIFWSLNAFFATFALESGIFEPIPIMGLTIFFWFFTKRPFSLPFGDFMGILETFGDLTEIKAIFSLLAFEEFLGIFEGLLSMLRDLTGITLLFFLGNLLGGIDNHTVRRWGISICLHNCYILSNTYVHCTVHWPDIAGFYV